MPDGADDDGSDDDCSENLLQSSSDEGDDDSVVPELVAATIQVDYNNNVNEFEQVNELSQTIVMLTARSRTCQDFKQTKWDTTIVNSNVEINSSF